MKKLVIYFFVILMLFVNVSAITSNLKESYEKKETAIVELSGSILNTLSKSNVKILKDGHINSGTEYNIKKLNNKYYLWFTSPQIEGNYTLLVENILTNEGGIQKNINFEDYFIVSGNTTDYSIEPGIIFASEDFSINIALYAEDEESIDIDLPNPRSFLLQQGNNRVDFKKNDFQGTSFLTIKIGKYSIPAYVMGAPIIVNNSNINNTNSTNSTILNQSNSTLNGTALNNSLNQTKNEVVFNGSFKVLPLRIEAIVLKGNKTDLFPFTVTNLKNETLSNISLEYDKNIFKIIPENISSLKINESVIFNIKINDNLTRAIKKSIIVTSGKEFQYLIFELYFTNKEENVEIYYNLDILNSPSGKSLLHCVGEINNGKICSASGEVCDKRTILSKEGDCCTSKCTKEEGESKSWIGYLIIGIAVLVLIFIYLKYKKVKPSANPMSSIGKTEPMGLPPRLPPELPPGMSPPIGREGFKI